jgi:hypothetical protein
MSGYLTNLLRRTFEPSPGMVQPRFNALFAPPAKSPALQFPTQQPEPVGELTNADEHAPALSDTQPRPSPGATGPTAATNEISLHQPAISTHISPEMSVNRVVLGDGDQTEASPTALVGTVEVNHSESSKPLHTNTAARSDRDSEPSPIVARPSRDRTKLTARTATAVGQKEQSASLVHAQDYSPKPEVSASLVDQHQPVSGHPSEVHAVRAVDQSGQARPEGVSGSKAAAHVLREEREPLASKSETRDVLGAHPLSSAENRNAAGSAEPRSSESTSIEPILEPGPLSFRPPIFRQLGRREPNRTELPEPTVEVTIGRIEVRGTAPTEPRQPTAQPSRRLSLEEYLRRRSGRSRE